MRGGGGEGGRSDLPAVGSRGSGRAVVSHHHVSTCVLRGRKSARCKGENEEILWKKNESAILRPLHAGGAEHLGRQSRAGWEKGGLRGRKEVKQGTGGNGRTPRSLSDWALPRRQRQA